MATDWKDALAALRGSEAAPIDNTPDAPEPAPDKSLPHLTISIDRKGRKGKTATIVEGFDPHDESAADTARILKQKIGTGGSSRGGEILLQGDWRQRAADILRDMGFKVKTI